MGPVTLEEAHEFITEIYQHYVCQFGPEILDNQ